MPAAVLLGVAVPDQRGGSGGDRAGAAHVRVRSVYGEAQQSVAVSSVAPAIFLIGDSAGRGGGESGYTLNAPSTRCARGQTLIIYATGLGRS